MCLQTTLGVRALCEDITPLTPPIKYRYYLDDLNGISYHNYDKVSSVSSNAKKLFQTAIEEGINSTITDALFSVDSRVQLNQVYKMYYHNTFTEKLHQPDVMAQERGISFMLVNPSRHQFSSLFVRTFYVMVAADLPTLDVNIYDGSTLVKTETLVGVEAGKTYAVQVDMKFKEIYGSIKFVQDTFDVYQAKYNSDFMCCGNFINYSNGFNYVVKYSSGISSLKIEGGFGVSADVDVICDEDKIRCTLIPYLGEEIRFKAGIYLANEVLISDRLELFVLNNKEDILEVAKQWQKEYDTKMKRKIPNIFASLRGTDKCCFKNTGITKSIQLI